MTPAYALALIAQIFTAAQAERGGAVFAEACAGCHAPSQFTGAFHRAWAERAGDLAELIRTTMPYDSPGRLSREQYADIVAYLFRLNGVPAAADGEWRYWGGDAGSTRYSALDLITPDNAKDLRVAWRWTAPAFGSEAETYYRATPLYADGVLYTVAGERRGVIALDPATGRTLWTWSMDEGLRWEKAPRRFSGRGLAYWSDGRTARVLVVTPGYHLVSLDARTGRPDSVFGADGVVDLMRGLGYELVPWAGAPG
ncbi:MAG: c-type cytochrome, partial [Gemmatimonadales bacterium]